MDINLYDSFIYALDDGYGLFINNDFVDSVDGNSTESFGEILELASEYGYETDLGQPYSVKDYIKLKSYLD